VEKMLRETLLKKKVLNETNKKARKKKEMRLENGI